MAHFLDSAKQIFSIILALIMLPITLVNPPAEGYEALNPDELQTSFTVLSDIHIEGNRFSTFNKYSEILKQVNASAHNDTLVFLGDNTMAGQHIESHFFYGALRVAKPAENLVIAPGNHDYGNGEGDYEKFADRFLTYSNYAGCKIDSPYYYKVIDGYYFIVLSSESDVVNGSDISDKQLEWLKSVLDEASKEDKPVFVFSHHPVNYVEVGSYDRVSKVVREYKNVIFFCGHTHFNLYEHSVYTVDGVLSVNVPRSTDNVSDPDKPGVGAVVEVYENEVLLRFRDFTEKAWVEGYEYSFTF